MKLSELVLKAQKKDIQAINALYDDFYGSINYYGKTEDIKSELKICLLESILKLKPNKIKLWNNNQIAGYIRASLRNRSNNLLKKNSTLRTKEYLSIDQELLNKGLTVDFNNKLIINELLEVLTPQQKKVIIYKYIYISSDIEIAKDLKISR